MNSNSKAKNQKKAQRDRERYLKRKAAREATTVSEVSETVPEAPAVAVVEVKASEIPNAGAKIEEMEREYEATLASKDAEIATLKAAKERLEKTVERLERELSTANSRNASLVGDAELARSRYKKLFSDF